MTVGFILCSLPIVLILLFYGIFRALVSKAADEGTLEEAIERSGLLHQQLLTLPDGEAGRLSVSRTVVDGLLKNSRYLSYVLWQWRISDDTRSKPERKEIGELRAAALRRAWKLHTRANKLSSRLRSKRAPANWESIADAVLEHDAMWTSYSGFSRLNIRTNLQACFCPVRAGTWVRLIVVMPLRPMKRQGWVFADSVSDGRFSAGNA
jgi:hypothetical protein